MVFAYRFRLQKVEFLSVSILRLINTIERFLITWQKHSYWLKWLGPEPSLLVNANCPEPPGNQWGGRKNFNRSETQETSSSEFTSVAVCWNVVNYQIPFGVQQSYYYRLIDFTSPHVMKCKRSWSVLPRTVILPSLLWTFWRKTPADPQNMEIVNFQNTAVAEPWRSSRRL